VAEVIPYLGDTVEMHEVILTVPGYGHDFFPLHRRQTAIALFDLPVVFQILHHIIRLSQSSAFGREETFHTVAEISVYPETGQRIVHQLAIQFHHISRASDKNDLPHPSAGMPVDHDNVAKKKTDRDHQESSTKQEEKIILPAQDTDFSPPEKGRGDHGKQQHHFKHPYSFLIFVFPIIMHIFFLKLY
jgi:hypothetical protein